MFDKHVDQAIIDIFDNSEDWEWEAYVASEGLTPIKMVMSGVTTYNGVYHDHHEQWTETIRGWLIDEGIGMRSAISDEGECMLTLLDEAHDFADWECV